jgi:beta-N-acetylhexosaminidase
MADLRQALGSMLVCGFDGADLPKDFRELLSRGHLGGIILFTRNYTDSARLAILTQTISRCSQQQPLLAVDQEGGRVVRFAGDFPAYPSPQYYHRQQDADGLIEATQKTAAALRSLGINLNLIPVCDLAPDEPGHVIHSRSYSADPEELAAIVSRQVKRLSENNILSCAKHFPGLGSAYGDPHLVVSRSDQTLSVFRERDYLPFKAAIAAGVDMVMVTHLIAPAIDANQIVTFSRLAIEEELKGHLGYAGLVISDDLQMLGALQGTTPVQAGIAAIMAGCDLLIFGNATLCINQIIDDLVGAAERDDTLAARIIESGRRVIDFKRRKLDNVHHE